MVVGKHDLLIHEDCEKEIQVLEIIKHELYNPDTNDNDVALLRLSEEVNFDRFVKPVCLPSEDAQVNTLCFVVGWGETRRTYS